MIDQRGKNDQAVREQLCRKHQQEYQLSHKHRIYRHLVY